VKPNITAMRRILNLAHAKKLTRLTTIHALVQWIAQKDMRLCVKPCAIITTVSTMKLATVTAKPTIPLVIANMNWIIALYNALEIPHVRLNVVQGSSHGPSLAQQVQIQTAQEASPNPPGVATVQLVAVVGR